MDGRLFVVSQVHGDLHDAAGLERDANGLDITLKTRGIVQVSMNLTNYEETPVHVAYEAVKAEAAKRGVEVQSSEVIGLIPEAAVAQVAGHYLKLENFSMSQILEARMAQVMTRDLSTTVGQFLQAVSAPNVAPGGGRDRKSTRLNSSHGYISYAVFCLKKKKKKDN